MDPKEKQDRSPGRPLPSEGIFNGAFDPKQAAEARVRDFTSIVAKALEDLETNRAKMALFSILLLPLLLWPVLFSLNADGYIAAPWVAIWTPLWIWDAIGFLFLAVLVSWGHLKPPEGMEEDWKDPFPLYRRVLELVKWTSLMLFQVLLPLRLDGDIGWSWSAVMSPVVAWAALRMLQRLYTLHRNLPSMGADKYLYAMPHGMLVLQLVLILLKLEGEVGWIWPRVLLPVWFYAMVPPGDGAEVELDSSQPSPPFRDLDEGAMRVTWFLRCLVGWAKAFGFFFCFCSLLLGLRIIEGDSMSTFVVFIPVFLGAGLGVWIACTKGQPTSLSRQCVGKP